MFPLHPWAEFLHQQMKAPPMRFVHGMHNRLSRGISCGVHAHPSFEIIYHPIGHGFARVNRQQTIPFHPGALIIHAPNELHDQELQCDGEDCCVQIAAPEEGCVPTSGLYLPDVNSSTALEEIHQLSRGNPRSSEAEQAILNLRATALLLDLIQMACVHRAHDEADPAEQHILRAEQFIRESFATIGSLLEVARYVGVSPDHLRHVFKARRRKPLIRHLNEVRIERAKTLLRHSNLPLKQIASMCGFKDEYYFSAVFLRIVRVSPGTHRRGGRHTDEMD